MDLRSFDAKLSDELRKRREELSVRKILEGEYSDRDLAKIYGNQIVAKQPLLPSKGPGINLPGELVTGGVSALLAPLLLSAVAGNKISTAVKLLAMPIAGLGGASIYSLLHGPKSAFSDAYPIKRE